MTVVMHVCTRPILNVNAIILLVTLQACAHESAKTMGMSMHHTACTVSSECVVGYADCLRPVGLHRIDLPRFNEVMASKRGLMECHDRDSIGHPPLTVEATCMQARCVLKDVPAKDARRNQGGSPQPD